MKKESAKPEAPLESYRTPSSALFGKKKDLDEFDRLAAEAESRLRQRDASRNRALDVMLKVLLVALILIAVTRLAGWLAKAF